MALYLRQAYATGRINQVGARARGAGRAGKAGRGGEATDAARAPEDPRGEGDRKSVV